jgi:hypothetical protein
MRDKGLTDMKTTPKALTHSLPLISTCRFAYPCLSRPSGSIREQAAQLRNKFSVFTTTSCPWLISISLELLGL